MITLAVSTTIIRIVIPLLAAVGGAVGAGVGAFKAITTAIPERSAIIVGYQAQVIDDLVTDNKRLAESVAHLEGRVRELEDEPRSHLA